MINDKYLKSIVKDAIQGMDIPGRKAPSKKIDEAYVVQTKKFDIKTEKLSDETKSAHQDLMDGYVKSLNEVSARLDTADKNLANPNDSVFRQLKVDEAHNINAAFLHGLYFGNIGSLNSQITVDSLTYIRLARDFGDFNNWQKDFIACALSSRNGWVVTCYNIFLKRYMNVVVDLHSYNIPFGSIPVIVVDCWEHAYFKDFSTKRKDYVFAMMSEFDWQRIEERIQKAESIAKVMA